MFLCQSSSLPLPTQTNCLSISPQYVLYTPGANKRIISFIMPNGKICIFLYNKGGLEIEIYNLLVYFRKAH